MRISDIHIRPSYAAIMVSIPVLIYAHYRAATLAFTYDECWTFLGYASADVWSIVTNQSPAANNHVLHSMLMKLFVGLFGSSEYVLRIPALGGMLLFMVYLFKLSWGMLKKLWWVGYVSVLYQPYLLDYFAIARGYALAIAFTFGSIYYLDRLVRRQRVLDAWLALGLAFLAAYANFTYLLIFCSVALAVVFVMIQSKKWRQFLRPLIGVTIVVVALTGIPITRLMEAQELYYGGDAGFYSDTLLSLANRAWYNRFEGVYLAACFGLVLIISCGWLLINIGRATWKHVGFWCAWVLLATSVGSILQHYIMGSPFLIDRTALFMLPLLILTACWLIFSYEFTKWKWRLGFLLVGLSLVNLSVSLNTTHQLDFIEHADTREAVSLIQELAADDASFHVGKSTYMNATIMFYKKQLDVRQIEPAGLEFCDEAGKTPFYYLFAKDIACVQDKRVVLVKYFPVSDTYLYREGT